MHHGPMDSSTGPRRNRVTPFGDVVAIDLRGAWLGNRGILHRGADVVRHDTGIAWIVCVLEFRDRRVAQWTPGHYTPLFFLDEAVAFAAGHRPCAECRRPAFRRFVDALGAERRPRAPELDRLLHTQRWQARRGRRLHDVAWTALPDGAFVVYDGTPALILGDTIAQWATRGYGKPVRRPRTGTATVQTPPATLTALAAGYPVQIDAGATRPTDQRSSRTAGSGSSTDA
jgi:hypothetical protein